MTKYINIVSNSRDIPLTVTAVPTIELFCKCLLSGVLTVTRLLVTSKEKTS